MKTRIIIWSFALIVLFGFCEPLRAVEFPLSLEQRVTNLENRVRLGPGAGVAFLFGAFCALWAQYTKRNPWLWFFTGAIFSVITVLVLLYKNAKDLHAGHIRYASSQ